MNLSERQRREVEDLAAAYRAQGRPHHEIAAEIAATAQITPLWAWRLAKGWYRGELLEQLRQLGDPSVDESMLWRWETGERDPSRKHLDWLCQVYQTRPDLLGYGRDYSQPVPREDGGGGRSVPVSGQGAAAAVVAGALTAEPLAMVQALTASGVSLETVEFLERSAERRHGACTTGNGRTAAAPPLAELAMQYRMVGAALQQGQRVAERRRLARVAAQLGGQLGLALWELDEPAAVATSTPRRSRPRRRATLPCAPGWLPPVPGRPAMASDVPRR
ncbi:MAG TPA: helix-turn-helix transcriptional regulator [Streptosporangiaceae bacterium]